MARKSCEGGACERPAHLGDIQPQGFFENVMCIFDDYIAGPLNVLDRIERVLTSIRFRDIGHQIAILRMDRGGSHTDGDATRILKQFVVPVWGRTHNWRCSYIHVKQRQAKWARDILNNAGVVTVEKDGTINYPSGVKSSSKGSGGKGGRYIPWKRGGSKARQAEPKQGAAQRVAGWFK